MNKFTNHNVPGFVDAECYTAFYEGDVDKHLVRVDGSVAPVIEWDLKSEIPRYKSEAEIRVIRVTRIPETAEEIERLHLATLNARHYNIRLIVPKHRYNVLTRANIDGNDL